MYFGSSDEIDSHNTLDIDGDTDIVRLNKHEMDNKSKKNIAAYLRGKISEHEYRFNNGMCINPDEVLKVVLTDEDIDFNDIDILYIGDLEFKRKRFKNSYDNVKMFSTIKNGEDDYYLKEEDRYLSREESCHMIGLIDKSENITFSIDAGAWIKIRKG